MPTPKQKLAFSLISENIRNPRPDFTLGKTMLQVGYSPSVAESPTLVTESKGFRELMDAAGLDDASLTRAHRDLLQMKRVDYFVFPKAMPNEEIKEHVNSVGIKLITIRETEKGKMAFYHADDPNAKKAALDMAYKLRGSYAPEKKAVVHAHFGGENANPKVKKIVSNFEEELKKTLMQ